MSRTVHVWDAVGRSGSRHSHGNVGAVELDALGGLRVLSAAIRELVAAYAPGEWRRFEYAPEPPDDRPEHLRSLPRTPPKAPSSGEPIDPPE